MIMWNIFFWAKLRQAIAGLNFVYKSYAKVRAYKICKGMWKLEPFLSLIPVIASTRNNVVSQE